MHASIYDICMPVINFTSPPPFQVMVLTSFDHVQVSVYNLWMFMAKIVHIIYQLYVYIYIYIFAIIRIYEYHSHLFNRAVVARPDTLPKTGFWGGAQPPWFVWHDTWESHLLGQDYVIWWFPKMVVPPNRQFVMGFSIMYHPARTPHIISNASNQMQATLQSFFLQQRSIGQMMSLDGPDKPRRQACCSVVMRCRLFLRLV